MDRERERCKKNMRGKECLKLGGFLYYLPERNS